MILGLQIDQRLRTEPDRFVEHGNVEIRDADMARKPLPFGLGERGNGRGNDSDQFAGAGRRDSRAGCPRAGAGGCLGHPPDRYGGNRPVVSAPFHPPAG